MTGPIIEGWIDVRTGADFTGYSTAYVRLLARQGRIAARKVNRGWLVNRADLLAYKLAMDRLGEQKHNPWRDDLTIEERGRQGGGETERAD